MAKNASKVTAKVGRIDGNSLSPQKELAELRLRELRETIDL